MSSLATAVRRRGVRSTLGLLVCVTAASALVAAFTVSTGGAAAKDAPGPITLTFAGEVIGEGGIAEPVAPYPPIEGGAALRYTVPTGYRLVIDSVYADASETWDPGATYPRSGLMVGIDTSYDLGESCPYPGFLRAYDVPLTTEVSQVFGEDEAQTRRAGQLSGPIVVEGGRTVNGTAWAPGGDSTLYVHVVAHGNLQPATNPTPPTCGS